MTKKLFYTFALLFAFVLVSAQSCQQKSAPVNENSNDDAMMEDNFDNTMTDDEATESGDEMKREQDGAMMEEKNEGAMMAEEGGMMSDGEVKTFEIDGGKFYFSPNSITVNKGDTVKIVFNNVDGFHDFRIDEFNAKTKQINTGESETIEFVADQAGSFEYYCSVGNHRQLGMVGTLVVNE